MSKKILYVGGFELPDKNAAAHRVIGIAKAIRELGNEVYFLNYASDSHESSWKNYFGFSCYDNPKQGLARQITDISDVIKVVRKKQIDCIIMYNYPAIAMSRLIKSCKKANIKCYADVTEWYVTEGRSLYARIKTFDTNLRMKKLHFNTDGVIAISDFLYQYYKDKVPTVKIPPIVDIQDEKWIETTKANSENCVFVYAGSPSSQKECLDVIVDAVEKTRFPALLQIVGITQKQYEEMYQTKYAGEKTEFWGRVEHERVVDLVKKADWSVIIRENNKVVKAGFPTKLVESISCGTPVLANRFSNIEEYLDDRNSILCEMDEINMAIDRACQSNLDVDNKIFDYRRYIKAIQKIIE